MFQVECIDRTKNIVTKRFHIHGTNTDLLVRNVKKSLRITGMRCTIEKNKTSEVFSFVLIPHNQNIKVLVKEI